MKTTWNEYDLTFHARVLPMLTRFSLVFILLPTIILKQMESANT